MKDRRRGCTWMYVKPYRVKVTRGRFDGEYGNVVAHDGPMRIVNFERLAGQKYRVHVDNMEVIGERRH